MNNISEIRRVNIYKTHKAGPTVSIQNCYNFFNLSPSSFFSKIVFCTVHNSLHIFNFFLKYGKDITVIEKALATETNRPGLEIRIHLLRMALEDLYNLSVS